MHFPVSPSLDRNAILFGPPALPADRDLSVVWIVQLTTWRINVLERTYADDKPLAFRPVSGLDLRLGSHPAVPEERIHARFMGLLAKLLVVCRANGRFDQLIVVGDERLRGWLKRYFDAATRTAVLAEYDPEGLISKALTPTRRFGLCLHQRFPVLFPLVEPVYPANEWAARVGAMAS